MNETIKISGRITEELKEIHRELDYSQTSVIGLTQQVL